MPYVPCVDTGHLERADLQNTATSLETPGWWGQLGLMMSTAFPSCNLKKEERERKKKHCPAYLILIAFCFPIFFRRKMHTDMCMHQNT